MLRMLDLVCKILKICLLVTVARLLSTAFNWEFGISGQYLRFLEWMFQSGKRRIEKVESEQRLHGDLLSLDDEVAAGEEEEEEEDADDDQERRQGRRPSPPSDLNFALVNRKGSESLLDGMSEDLSGNGVRKDYSPSSWNGRTNVVDNQQQQQQKMRRISTPDGPPVFLFDQFDEDEEEDQEVAVCEGENQQATGKHNVRHHQHEFHLLDPTRLVVKGISAIIDDQVTKRFTREQLKTWNLLTRTNAKNYQFMSRSLGLYWLVGVLIRYSILMPMRILFTLVGFLWLTLTMCLLGLVPSWSWRRAPYKLLTLMSFRMLSCGITSKLTFHNRQWRAKLGDVCVANHTSPLDVVLLACDNCYALVGQRHGGLLGLLEVALSRASQHVWFDRAEMRDRQLVTQRLREHVSDKTNLPVLIFPEGTCINNSAVMMFRKGAFETTDRICPVAIKYDARFGDPFWNSSKQSYVQYLLLMMSSWAIKCDVWYLKPMDRLPGESSALFAQRVKAEIAKQGGLDDLAWDGQLKRSSVKPTWLFQQQEDYASHLKLE